MNVWTPVHFATLQKKFLQENFTASYQEVQLKDYGESECQVNIEDNGKSKVLL